MATEDLLQAEARERPRMAAAAALAALLTLAAPVIGGIVLKDAPDNVPGAALFRHAHQTGLAVSAACSVLGLVVLVLVLDFLYRATRARNPQLPAQLRPLPWLGGIGLAVLTIALQIVSTSKLAHFATHGSQTYDEAKAASNFGAVAFLGIAAQLALAFSIVMISVNAMRVGLLSRFLGYLGVISAVLFVLPFVPIPIVQVYWLGALAALFIGRTPSGVPPAWQTGEATPWPSTAAMRDARVRAAEERRGGDVAGEEAAAGGAAAAIEQPGGAGGASARRKRKKRR